MSYEGHEIWLCRNGHLRQFNCYATPSHNTARCDCGELFCYFYSVDETNGRGVGILPKVYEEAKTETCGCCGHVKVVAETRYCIPQDRHWADDPARTPLVPFGQPRYRNNYNRIFNTERAAANSYGADDPGADS